MSDIFNHGLDAYESAFYGDGFPTPKKVKKYTITDKIIHETEKAILFRFESLRSTFDYWMPKSKLIKTNCGYEADVKIVVKNMKESSINH